MEITQRTNWPGLPEAQKMREAIEKVRQEERSGMIALFHKAFDCGYKSAVANRHLHFGVLLYQYVYRDTETELTRLARELADEFATALQAAGYICVTMLTQSDNKPIDGTICLADQVRIMLTVDASVRGLPSTLPPATI